MASALAADHPVMGLRVGESHIYTRTAIVYMINIDILLDLLCENIEVVDPADTVRSTDPCIVMLQYRTRISGTLAKRRRRERYFHSMLNLDVAYRGHVPHLKLSRSNTIHVTGHCDTDMLQAIVLFLLNRYRGRGLAPVHNAPTHGFAVDVVMANLSFQLGNNPQQAAAAYVAQRRRASDQRPVLDLTSIRDTINGDNGPTGSDWSAMLTANGKTLKIQVFRQPWNNGCTLALYDLPSDTWIFVTAAELQERFGVRTRVRSGVEHFRLSSGGTVVQVGRWPGLMTIMQQGLLQHVNRRQNTTPLTIQQYRSCHQAT